MGYPKTLLDTSKMTAIADAVRAKTGTTELMTAAQIAEAIENIPQGGGGDLDALIDGSISGALTISASKIKPYAFLNCASLESVSMPDVTTVGVGAFANCTALKNVSMPKITTVPDYSSSFPYGGFFYMCTGLEEFTSQNAPKLTVFSRYMFFGCTGLKRVQMTQAISFRTGGYPAFQGCTNLKEFRAPAAALAYSNTERVLANLPALEIVDILGTAVPYGSPYIPTFNADTNLKTIIMRTTAAVAGLLDAYLTGTPFAENGAGGVLYVPQSMINAYKTATTWVKYFGDNRAAGYANNQILPIEGSEYEL